MSDKTTNDISIPAIDNWVVVHMCNGRRYIGVPASPGLVREVTMHTAYSPLLPVTLEMTFELFTGDIPQGAPHALMLRGVDGIHGPVTMHLTPMAVYACTDLSTRARAQVWGLLQAAMRACAEPKEATP